MTFRKRRLCWLLPVVGWCLFFAACQKVELPATEVENPSDTGVSVPGTEEDDPPVLLPGEYADEWTVAAVKAAYPTVATDSREFCTVVGYIVGYVKSNSMNTGAVFSSEDAVKTNLMIADRKNETDAEHCLPVQLSDEKQKGIREALNLSDNPGLLGKRICLSGYISKYLNAVGMRTPEAFAWVETVGNEPGAGHEPKPEPAPEPVPPLDEEKMDTLKIDEKPTVIPGGRSVEPSWRKEDG